MGGRAGPVAGHPPPQGESLSRSEVGERSQPPSLSRLQRAARPRPAREHSLWLTSGPDILERTERERLGMVEGLGAWLDHLESPVQLLVCGRRLVPPAPPLSHPGLSMVERLGTALAQHLSSDLEASPYHPRSVYLAASGDSRTGEEVVQALERCCGVTSSRAESVPLLAEGPWEEGVSQLEVGGLLLATLRLVQLPAVEVEPGWLWALVGLRADFDLSIAIRPRTASVADRRLRYRMRGLQARQLADNSLGRAEDPRVAAALSSAGQLRQVLARAEGHLFETRISITVAAADAHELQQLQRLLRTRIGAMRGTLSPCWLDQLPARADTLPGSLETGPSHLLETGELASCWPWLDSYQAQTGCFLGRQQRSGAPLFLDLFDQTVLANANLSVVAASGSGKSYLAGLVALESIRQGVRVVVIDPENEHQGWCRGVGGLYLTLGEEIGVGFNVLEMEDPAEAALATVELASVLCGPLAPAEVAALSDAVSRELRERTERAPVLSDCLPQLAKAEAGPGLVSRLSPWLEGRAGSIFNRPGRGPEVASLVAIGLRELPPAWVAGATLLLSHWLWSWVRHQPGPKQAVVDEAGLLADNPELQRLMTQLARRVRKYQGSLVLLTQGASDLLAGGPGEIMAVNSGTLLLGNQPAAAAARLEQAFSLDQHQRQWLERSRRGEFLLVQGGRRSPMVVRAPPLHHLWLTGGE